MSVTYIQVKIAVLKKVTLLTHWDRHECEMPGCTRTRTHNLLISKSVGYRRATGQLL